LTSTASSQTGIHFKKFAYIECEKNVSWCVHS